MRYLLTLPIFLTGCGAGNSDELWIKQSAVIQSYPVAVQIVILLWWPILWACIALPIWAFMRNASR